MRTTRVMRQQVRSDALQALQPALIERIQVLSARLRCAPTNQDFWLLVGALADRAGLDPDLEMAHALGFLQGVADALGFDVWELVDPSAVGQEPVRGLA